MAPVIAKVALYCADYFFHKKIHFVAGHITIISGLKKALYIVTNELWLSFFISEIPSFTFEIALSICCLKLRFTSSKIPICSCKSRGC